MSSKLACALLACGLGAAEPLATPAPVLGVDRSPEGCFVFNKLTRDAVVAFRRPQAAAKEALVVSVLVPGGGRVKCSYPDLAMENRMRIQFLDHGLQARETRAETERVQLGNLSPDEVRRKVASVAEDALGSRLSETAEARNQLAERRLMAQIELDQRMDELNFRSSNAVAENAQRRTRMALMENGDAEALRRYDAGVRREQTAAQLSQTAESLMNAASAYAAGEALKREQLEQEAKLLKDVLKDRPSQKAALEKSLDLARREASGTMAFHDTVVAALARQPRQSLAAGPIRPGQRLEKIAGERSGKADLLEVDLEAPEGLAVVYAEARFDRGGSHRTLFRQIAGTHRWRGEIVWPVEAHQARVTLQHPVTGKNLAFQGTVATNRTAPADAVRDSLAQLDKVNKQYKRTKARAQGSDGHRTMPTP